MTLSKDWFFVSSLRSQESSSEVCVQASIDSSAAIPFGIRVVRCATDAPEGH